MKVHVLLISVSVCQLCTIVYSQFTLVNGYCGNAITGLKYSEGSDFDKNLSLLFSSLTTETTLMFYNNSVGDGSDKVYGLFQCRYDVGFEVCKTCVGDATRKIVVKCPYYSEATVWYKECMLRYASRNIFSLFDKTYPGYSQMSKVNVTNVAEFSQVLDTAINGVIQNASSNSRRFASGINDWSVSKQLFSFAQCTPDINSSDCADCLTHAFHIMTENGPGKVHAEVYYPSCQLWYNTSGPILNDIPVLSPAPRAAEDQKSPTPPPAPLGLPSNKKSSKTAIIAAVASCASVGFLVLSVVLCICVCRKRPKDASNNTPLSSQIKLHRVESDVGSLGEEDVVYYDFATLKAVTGDFAAENKLGEGGFGSVYKGTLVDGENLAIKRLSDTSGQGTKEFTAEARFLAKLQHRNLVRLVGYCSEGEEKLLVYDFLYNSSLDGFLFDREKHPLLDWATRYNTIVGIAKGLQYLHEDSRFTIIHRDLKPENILMDDHMNPKIADFGLARLFEQTQKLKNTIRIAGTRGYMSPECLQGEYSCKTDVYSFGVMLLEIVTGHRMYKRNSQDDLLINAWRLWNEQRAIELVDPELNKSYSSKDIERCIQIGLLCLQPDAEQRPTMTNVVLMLTVGSIDLKLPSPPLMSFPQFNMPRLKTGEEQSDSDQFSSKSVTADLNTNPR